jgi:N-6 DNA Methylase
MAADPLQLDPDFEWLDHVQPVGLVVAPHVLKQLGLNPSLQTQRDTAEMAEFLADDDAPAALPDPWIFFSTILGWPVDRVAGAPGGAPLGDDLAIRLSEYETTLEPNWAVAAPDGASWQMLIRLEPAGTDPDQRRALEGWEATPHQRFERLLRETGVAIGLMLTDKELRLVYAPRGETSGWLGFPLRPLATVAGRAMLGGLKLMLGVARLFTDAEDRRLPALLQASRDAQAAVSTLLSEQVLGALHELLRGLTAAEPALIGSLAKHQPTHLYEGLLTVLLRLVFVLYAEDRDLIPSRTDAGARDFYDQGYSVRGLHAKLLEDAAHHPDTMEERRGAWGGLLALFRLVHAGGGNGWIKARGGKLFDPEEFPFLEGRASHEAPRRVPPVTDGTVLRILDGLLTLKGERLSYRTLDVEQIGSVYETVMGFTILSAEGPSLAIKAGKNNRTPVFVDLAALAKAKPEDRLKRLKEEAHRGSLTAKQAQAVRSATDADALAIAFEGLVDERGSPGRRIVSTGTPLLQPTDERRRSGSHYTPRSLTEPIVRHALDPAFARLGPDARPEQVLDLKICDPAMGSGAFLVEACRALALRLVAAWARWPETRPTIPVDEDEELHARRLVAQRCLYGVDKNAMATDLAKLSLWLATLARDHEFTFLDHALKTGDSLVGLSRAQIAALNWDESKPGLSLLRGLVRTRFEEALEGRAAIREAPDDVARAIQEGRHRDLDRKLDPARAIGDAVIATFFTAQKGREREAKRAEIESWLGGHAKAMWPKLNDLAATLCHGPHPIRPFHWEIEFPEVFARENSGFDAVVGNPPFAGKNTIIASRRAGYLGWLQTLHAGAHGNADLVAHFYRRSFSLLRRGGVFGLVATNTIGQGDTRQTGLAAIIGSGGTIARAIRRLKWPGEAAVVVSVVHVANGDVLSPVLDGRQVRRISAYLVEGDLDAAPAPLSANEAKAFQGSIVLGMGFTFDDLGAAKGTSSSLHDMQRLIEKDPRNAECIFPYIGGEEVGNDPRQAHRRYVIDFGGMDEVEVRNRWPDLMRIVEARVKPQRESDKREARRMRWWLFGDRQPGLYRAIAGLDRVLVVVLYSPHMSFAFLPAMIYTHKLGVIASSSPGTLAVLQSRIHEHWARSFGSTLKDDLAYSLTDCFETFAFPIGFETAPSLVAAGAVYNEHRAQLMVARNEGLTKTYNRFHDLSETAADIIRLRELHAEMDLAVLSAYGWDDLAAGATPKFLDDGSEEDPKYQGRLFWAAEFRDEVLARLLALNAERHAEELRLGVAPRSHGNAGARTEDPEILGL